MENLDLRKAVAEAIGKKVILLDGKLFEDCAAKGMPCSTPHVLVEPYELGYHYALDALMEFCEKNYLEAEVGIIPGGRQECTIWKRGPILVPRSGVDLIANKYNDSLALAICEAIVEAAQKSEKEGKDEK